MWDFLQYLKNHSTDANFKHFSVSKNWAYDTYTARSDGYAIDILIQLKRVCTSYYKGVSGQLANP